MLNVGLTSNNLCLLIDHHAATMLSLSTSQFLSLSRRLWADLSNDPPQNSCSICSICGSHYCSSSMLPRPIISLMVVVVIFLTPLSLPVSPYSTMPSHHPFPSSLITWVFHAVVTQVAISLLDLFTACSKHAFTLHGSQQPCFSSSPYEA